VNARIPTARIAVVDDDPSFRFALLDLLESMTFHTKGFDSPAAYFSDDHAASFDCVLSDIQMPDMSGFDLLAELVRREWAVPVILITARLEQELDRKAQDGGALVLLRKPLNVASLVSWLQTAMQLGPRDEKHDRGFEHGHRPD
jgi:FixJ family two-component response regulator